MNDSEEKIATSFSVDDDSRKRNRRNFYLASWVLFPAVTVTASFSMAYTVTGNYNYAMIAGILGLGTGLWLRSNIEPLFRINNPTTGIFLTLDPLKSLFNKPDIITKYGPGPGYCYPWEQRQAINNISLNEASNDFKFSVLCTDGFLFGSGSYRIRAEKTDPIIFQAGVASVADDLRDLVITIAVQQLATKKVRTAVKQLEGLNKKLAETFAGTGQTNFEKRHGVRVGDVTVSQLKPSDDVQKTMSGLTEADAINLGTAIILGYKNMEAVNKAVNEGRLQQADVKDARDRFLSVSGNLEGMEIKRHEWVVSAHGIDPRLVEALARAAPNVGQAARDLGMAAQGMRGEQPRGGRNRNRQNQGGNDG